MRVVMSVQGLRDMGSFATAAQLRDTLEMTARSGSGICENTVRDIFWNIGPVSIGDMEAMLSSARTGAFAQYAHHQYAHMSHYDLLAHFLESRIETARSAQPTSTAPTPTPP